MAANDAIIRGVASILQDASAALARLGTQATQQPESKPMESPGASLADAAAALAQVASHFGAAAQVPTPSGNGHSLPVQESSDVYSGTPYGGASYGTAEGGHYDGRAEDGTDASMSPSDFCLLHQLESWVGEALDLLTPDQRMAVIDPPMNTCHARNLNGIVVSRIKQAVPLDQRLGIFVQINGLSEGVVDRISTLTPEQAEQVMESGLKIQKASNPSGVAMRRISDVLRNERQGKPSTTAAVPSSAPASYGAGSRERSRTPAPSSAGRSGQSPTSITDTPEDVQNVMTQLGLEWWCGEVLKRLSLWQRQNVLKDIMNVSNARNPSGVVMSRVKSFAEIGELMSIFIDINQFDSTVQNELWGLTPEQQNAVISPGIYLQNVRNPSTAVRSRIKNVLAGNDAFGKPM